MEKLFNPKKPVAPGDSLIKYNKIEIIKNKKKMPSFKHSKNKEAPFCASFIKASYTIEATIILPIFITFMMFGVFLFRLLEVEAGVQRAINLSTRTMAVVGYDNGEFIAGEDKKLMAETIAYSNLLIKSYKVPTKYIYGGMLGLNYSESRIDKNYLMVKVSYKVKFPIGILGKFSFDVKQHARCRLWVGWDEAESFLPESFVYLARYSEVYHRDIDCPYLSPSVISVAYGALSVKRNKDGHKYYSCRRCKGTKNDGIVFITDYGTLFHSDINCSRIKRHIRRVLVEEAQEEYPPCSKCASEEEEEWSKSDY